MVKLVSDTETFGSVVRPVRLDTGWPDPNHLGERENEGASTLAGPIILDVFQEMMAQGSDDLVQRIHDGTLLAGALLNAWTPDDAKAFRSALWRSAHRYLVQNIQDVDRGREIEELARVLKVQL